MENSSGRTGVVLPPSRREWPFVSVVIPVRNEADSIVSCVEAVLTQDYPAERMEVLVVDGMSDDRTREVVAEVALHDERVRLLSNPQRIVPTAMNAGIRAARGTIIARVDGHTRIAPDYIRIGVETLHRTGADNVGGPMYAIGGSAFGDSVAAAMSSRFGIGAYFHFGTRERDVDTVYMGMWPRAAFVRFGLFDSELVRDQDDELNYRIRKGGGRIVLNPQMHSAYTNRQSPRRLVKQFFEYGLWKVRVLQKHPRQMSWRHFVPPLFVATLAASIAATIPVPRAAWLAGFVGAAYGAGLIAATAQVCRRTARLSFPVTAAAFSLIHVAWGTGFLMGLLRFRHRWRDATTVPSLNEHEKRRADTTGRGVP